MGSWSNYGILFANSTRMTKWLSQRDPSWAATKMGTTALTLGQVGCYVTALINLANALKANPKGLTPADIAHNIANFDENAMLHVEHACTQIGGIAFEDRENYEDDTAIIQALKDPKRAVILQVNHGAHFSLCVGRSMLGLGTDFNIADSWDAKVKGAKAHYHNISGARFFKKII